MHPFKRLLVLERSRTAAIEVYKLTRSFPRDERFGIIAQLRRAAVSVGANIAEGSQRLSKRDFAHFLNLAEGSAGEVRFLLEPSVGLEYVSADAAASLIERYTELERMLCALRQRVMGES